ncbi:MAG TPA: tRNA (adenosine(37)-N6)-threonylcarbamoyltransferase complex ATPase subunit type 1 TsaE [Gammaproteobacteria bacterium]
MGESGLTRLFSSQEAFEAAAGETARRWAAREPGSLLVALHGDLGSGKTTWVRAMLRGLGYSGRVPSPTYTLVEQYALERLKIVHLDLYRLAADEELENLGLRDWLDEPGVWLLVEWPERAASIETLADLVLRFEIVDPASRRVTAAARTTKGAAAARVADLDS